MERDDAPVGGQLGGQRQAGHQRRSTSGHVGAAAQHLGQFDVAGPELTWPAIFLEAALQPRYEGGASGAVVCFDTLLDFLSDGAAGLAVGAERGRADAEDPGTGALVGGER